MRFSVCFLLIALACSLTATVTVNYNVATPDVSRGNFLNDYPRVSVPGQPALAYIPVRILLPQGERYTGYQVNWGDSQTLTGITLDSVPQPLPTSMDVTTNTTSPDFSVYNTDADFPSVTCRYLGTQRANGYDFALFNVYAYRYNPVQHTLTWYPHFNVSVDTTPDAALAEQQNRMLNTSSATQTRLSHMVDNPEAISAYVRTATMPATRPAGPYAMIVITNAASAPFFDDFVTWHNDHDISTGVFTTENIYAEYSGLDRAEQIRNFIIDCYQYYSGTDTPLQYVLLGGDDEIIPIRGVYVNCYGTIDNNLPCDMYYSDLDGNWDGDGDEVYGENSDDVDMVPEVAIGRIPAETQSEFENCFRKTNYYSDVSSYSNDRVCLMGELLNSDPLTWGDDYKETVRPYIPTDYHFTTLYQSQGTYSLANVMATINDGVGIVNHMGHANYNIVMGMSGANIASLTNTEYGFGYSQGCYACAFDNATSHESEAVGENLVIRSGGFYAFVGNTRYGWYSPGSVWGPSEYYDVAFFQGLFEQNIRRLGDANNYSKAQCLNQALNDDCMRWCYYEIILFGDPTVAVKDASGSFPYVTMTNSTVDDVTGDGDGMINPGETVQLTVTLRNEADWADADNVTATLTFADSTVQILEGTSNFGAITAGSSADNSAIPFEFTMPQNCVYSAYVYTVDVTATHGAATFHHSYSSSLTVSMNQIDWPWHTTQSTPGAPMLYDVNDDGHPEVISVDIHGDLNILNAQAQLLDGYPVNHNLNLLRSTAMGDFDHDGVPEIAFASRTGEVGAMKLDGSILFEGQNLGVQSLTPMIADLDGDGTPEIISYSIDRKVHVIRTDGTEMPNFPITLTDLCTADMGFTDLDGDGNPEIVLGTRDGLLHAFNVDGTEVSGFPVQLSTAVVSAPTFDCSKHIVVGTADHKVHMLSATGIDLLTYNASGNIAGSAILCDVNNDTHLDIVFCTTNGDLYVLQKDGYLLSGFPQATGCSVNNPPLAADVDNDGQLEIIVFTSQTNLFVYEADGSQIGFSPVPISLIGNTPGSIADLDGDGDLEFIAGVSNGVVALDCKLMPGTLKPWTTYRCDLARSGDYASVNPLGTDDPTIPVAVTRLIANYPNPFNPVTTIAYSLAKTGKIELTVYNLRGQKVRTLVNENVSAGAHTVVWNGTNDNGVAVASGVYFVRMVGDHQVQNRKMLLLK